MFFHEGQERIFVHGEPVSGKQWDTTGWWANPFPTERALEGLEALDFPPNSLLARW